MPHLRDTDSKFVHALKDVLKRLRIGGPPIQETLLPVLREALGARLVGAYAVAHANDRLELEWPDTAGPAVDPLRVRHAVGGFIEKHVGLKTFTVTRPEREQRNRVLSISQIEQLTGVKRGHAVPGQKELGLEHDDLVRVLVCDGPSMLLWVGAFRPEPFHGRQAAVLRAIVPSLRKYLVHERLISGAPRLKAALDAALEAIGAPAFVVSKAVRMEHANSAARALLNRDRRAVLGSIANAIAGRASEIPVEVVRLSGRETGYLAIPRWKAAPIRVAKRARAASRRWGLTPRQAEVLELVARGLSNRTISDTFRVSQRAVEMHVSAIFDKAGVESRASLLSLLLFDP
jgi:DNA-binding NarL/FixJ family response regulator